MNVLNKSFIDYMLPYVADRLQVKETDIYCDIRSIFVGYTPQIGVLGTEIDFDFIKTETDNNLIAIVPFESDYFEFSAKEGEYYYWLGSLSDSLELIVDDTYRFSLGSVFQGDKGFFFEKLKIGVDLDAPVKITVLRFRRVK